jgi:hypothetical protein
MLKKSPKSGLRLRSKKTFFIIEGVSKAHHLPLTLRSGYSSSEEDEKVIILNINTFPSFFKGGVSCPKGHDGVVKTLFRQHINYNWETCYISSEIMLYLTKFALLKN